MPSALLQAMFLCASTQSRPASPATTATVMAASTDSAPQHTARTAMGTMDSGCHVQICDSRSQGRLSPLHHRLRHRAAPVPGQPVGSAKIPLAVQTPSSGRRAEAPAFSVGPPSPPMDYRYGEAAVQYIGGPLLAPIHISCCCTIPCAQFRHAAAGSDAFMRLLSPGDSSTVGIVTGPPQTPIVSLLSSS